MYSVVLWTIKNELRLFNHDGSHYGLVDPKHLVPFPNSPRFETAEEGWEWIHENHPLLAP